MSLKIAGKLFTQRRFLPLFVLFQSGTFNDNALKNALIGLLTYGGVVLFSDMPRESVIPLAALLFTFPFFILSAIAGQLADKFDRGLILKVIKRVEVAIMLLAAIGFFLESPLILCITLVCMGAQSAFFSPTKNSVLPQWLEDDELVTGNGLLSGFQFFMILLGQSAGLILVLMAFPESSVLSGPRIVAVILITLALIGWFAAEKVPAAPAPAPELKVDYNPITATLRVLGFALKDMNVFRPMLGVAWFYGLSTIFITAFPTYVADVMRYDQNVLTAILVASTVGILIGSLLCVVLARGREAMGLCAFGIIGVALFTLDLYLTGQTSTREELGTISDFFAAPETPRFLIDVVGASLCNGLFVVPLQAMMQRRADPEKRARLMSAGSVMLNISVNGFTFMLIGLGYLTLAPNFPFLIIVIVSTIVAIYAVHRALQMKKAGTL